jgi:2-aminoethylphosphonate-pyruvate transaminase
LRESFAENIFRKIYVGINDKRGNSLMIIFSPGPGNISERVRKALLKPDICHRDKEFSDILRSSENLLLDILKLKRGYRSIFLCGSGTAAIDSVISSFGGHEKKLFIISNGIYGERAAAIARTYNIKIEEMKLRWGSIPDLNIIENRLKNNNIGAIYIVHHETTTGLINPLGELCAMAKRRKKLVLVDAVGSIAGEVLDIRRWGIDAAIGSANKCIRGVPGISFVIASERLLKTIKKCQSRSFYTNLLSHVKSEENGQTPFTPPVHVFYAFLEALHELKEEGVNRRIQRYQKITGLLRDGLKRLDIRFLLPEGLMSNTMTVVYIPHKHSYTELHDKFKKRGFVIYASQGALSYTTFRLGTVGIISKEDIEQFLKIFKSLL